MQISISGDGSGGENGERGGQGETDGLGKTHQR